MDRGARYYAAERMPRSKRAQALGTFLRAGVLAGSVLAGGVLASTSAQAHINLLEPVARVPGRPDSTLRLGPCGQRENERLEARASAFRPGQSIDVVWEAYVQHVSYFRIAFDPDGDDSFSTRPSSPSDASADDPTQLLAGDGELILDYILDRSGEVDRVERRVTLPDVECDRCTLQLTQFTYGLPLEESFYYQCADLVLDAGDDVLGAAGEPDAAGEGAGCSLAAAATRSRAGRERWGWLAPLAGALVLGARRSRLELPRSRARPGKAQGAGRDSIHSRSSST
jgi:hypothetical protein